MDLAQSMCKAPKAFRFVYGRALDVCHWQQTPASGAGIWPATASTPQNPIAASAS